MTRLTAVALAVLGALFLLPAPVGHADCTAGAGQLDCDFQQRISQADSYLADRPGTVGYVLRDRLTGAVYRNARADDLIWSASTIKLAIAVDLLTRNRSGAIRLTPGDQQLMQAMIHSSDNDATDTLWSRYGGGDHQTFNRDFPAYGMTSLTPQRGFSDIFPYWGFQKTTANDLDRLMTFTLTRMTSLETAALVSEMQNVDADQQWGVWGAGPSMAPGNKNGWSQEQGGWVVNSVGFAGPGQRYTLAVMNALGGAGGYDDGVATTTRLAELLLAGRSS
ncbi:MAG: serine hydrolase [Mycobacterium sp.]|nr:serine hydrolase [Mycobacterium sp.]